MAIDRDFLKRLAELTDGDEWAKADLLVEEFPPDEFGDHGEHANTGLHAELDAYETAMAEEYGIEVKASTMRNWRATSLAWPDATRVASASFEAHRMLLGDDRADRMARYLRLNKGKPLSRRHVARYRSEESPAKAGIPWEAQVARAVNSLAKRLLLGNVKTDRDDWWNAKAATKTRRNTVVAVLRSVAASIDGADE